MYWNIFSMHGPMNGKSVSVPLLQPFRYFRYIKERYTSLNLPMTVWYGPQVACAWCSLWRSRYNSVSQLLSVSSSGLSAWRASEWPRRCYWFCSQHHTGHLDTVVSLLTNQATLYVCVAACLCITRSAVSSLAGGKKTDYFWSRSVYEQWWRGFMNPKVTSLTEGNKFHRR